MPPTDDRIAPVPLLDVTRDNAAIEPELVEAAARVIRSGQFIGGPEVQALERSLALVSGTSHAVACASGSDALLLALMATGLEPGDEVLLPSFTFFATASAVTRLGGVPRFVDIDPATFNIDPARLEEEITSRTRCIIPVHLFGQCADMDRILDIARSHHLHVIEDCAQSIGATWRGRPAGSMGDIGCFSFYPTKNLGGLGDGGALVTQDGVLADRLRLFANHGMRPRYYHQVVGINSRLDAIQAAWLNVKLPHLAAWTAARAANAARYQAAFESAGLQPWMEWPVAAAPCGHAWNQYTVRIREGRRDSIRQQLADAGIGSEIYYPVPLHRQECFRGIIPPGIELPETDRAASEVLSLPVYPGLRQDEQDRTVNRLRELLAGQVQGLRQAA